MSLPIQTNPIPCPNCGVGTLVAEFDPARGGNLLTCSGQEPCGYSEPEPIEAEMRRLGAPVLPGFE